MPERPKMNNNDIAEKIAATRRHQGRRPQDRGCGVCRHCRGAAANEEIALSNFGKFKVKATPEREGRNPATGETIKIAAARKLAFTPAKAIKDKLNG
jgi:DNA-binding protein HU-beta